jgi:hypothetical protein
MRQTQVPQMTINKLRLWSEHGSWEEAHAAWELGAKEAAEKAPIKSHKKLPLMPGITADTAKNLKWKSLKWMLQKDSKGKILAEFLKHPVKYTLNFLRSLKKKAYIRDDDFFLYGIASVEQFHSLLYQENTLLVVGFSYCHKPFECPSGRFTDQCRHDPDHPICRQCFIGKCTNALPVHRTIPLYIPTVHYISEKLLDLMAEHPGKQILFLITACELTLEMFGDFGNMSGIKGIGVRLDGRICNTMKAFELSENGIKPGLTVVLDHTQERILNLIRYWRKII